MEKTVVNLDVLTRYMDIQDPEFLSTMREYQLEMVRWMTSMGAQEPGPREWSPRTDPRYCRKPLP